MIQGGELTTIDAQPRLVNPLIVDPAVGEAPVVKVHLPSSDEFRRHRVRARLACLLRYGVSPFLVLADLVALALAGLLTQPPLQVVALLAVAAIGLNALAGLYRSRLSLSALDDAPALVGRGLAAGAAAMAVAVLLHQPGADRALAGSALYAVATLIVRSVSYAAVRNLRRAHWVAHPTLVLGAGRIGSQLATLLLAHPEYGLAPVGFLDADPLLSPGELPVPVLGSFEDLAAVIRRLRVKEVIIAFSAARESEMVDLLRTCDRLECEIFFVPRLFEMFSGAGRANDTVWGLPLVRLRRAAFRTPSWALKRCFDVAVAALALVALAPLLAVIAVAVSLDGGGGCLFRQERVGLDGRPFRLLKFRSLAPVSAEDSATRWSVADDPRLGRLGRFLRRSSLDELPQLWNVLRGEMSIVGPRPERPHFVAEFARSLPRYTHRHRVPSGLTGWAQIHGLRGDTSVADRASFDNFYIENWSLWLDAKIALRTAIALRRGAR